MSPSPALAELALRVDELLMRPGNMAASREMVESYLAGRVQGTVDAIRFPLHPNEPEDPSIDQLVPLTPGQMAAALVALHDVYCDGVEKVVAIPPTLPPSSEEATPADEGLIRDWKRAETWWATLMQVRNLGDYSLQWFTLQLRRFERILPSANAQHTTPPPPSFASSGTMLIPSPPSVETPQPVPPAGPGPHQQGGPPEDCGTIGGKRGTVNQRMLEELQRNPLSAHWTQRKWATVLKCSPAAVAKAAAWGNVKTVRAMAYVDRLDR
jgi:hypothetical protein